MQNKQSCIFSFSKTYYLNITTCLAGIHNPWSEELFGEFESKSYCHFFAHHCYSSIWSPTRLACLQTLLCSVEGWVCGLLSERHSTTDATSSMSAEESSSGWSVLLPCPGQGEWKWGMDANREGGGGRNWEWLRRIGTLHSLNGSWEAAVETWDTSLHPRGVIS